MKLPDSFVTVTSLSKTLAILLFVSLPFAGFILGVNYQKATFIPPSITLPIPTPRIETNLPTKGISVSNFLLEIPSSWQYIGFDEYGQASIVTATTPYQITLKLNIVKTDLSRVTKGDRQLGKTNQVAEIYEEVGIGGARLTPYIVIYPNSDAYSFQWDYSSAQPGPPNPDGIEVPATNFTQDDLLSIVKSSTHSSNSLDSLKYKYDKNKFTVTKEITTTLDNKNIDTLSFMSLGFSKPVLKIFDLSNIQPPVDSLNKLFFFTGGDYPTTIRPVTISSKTYKFTRQTFAEGFPIEGKDGCFQGGGYHDDYFILDNKLGFLVNSSFSESGCGKESKKVNTPNPQTLEDAIKIIESISY